LPNADTPLPALSARRFSALFSAFEAALRQFRLLMAIGVSLLLKRVFADFASHFRQGWLLSCLLLDSKEAFRFFREGRGFAISGRWFLH